MIQFTISMLHGELRFEALVADWAAMNSQR
jgi:hypothetical protein